ncbi:phage major capsid protein [Streptomyces dubilierae]|uniref:Phage major capsid protein n=1 Tax=Streptomyces dubilierae TaxID=3075533 RepID=A0ABU2P6Z2_9ACTN|nr:phage major capsid protein [Streptomyces sp. DSM 41921]MDT0387910.1 phage major capsid protein [Streptomyces sp. DSM 41921]
MPFDPVRASRDELKNFLERASRPELMAALQTIDTAFPDQEITGHLGGFYDAASRALLDEITELRALVSRGSTEDGTPFDRSASGGFQARGAAYDRAMRTVDAAVQRGQLPAYGAERVETLLTTGLPVSRSLTARWATAAGDPAYETAFAKLASDPERGHLLWTREEGDAYRRAVAVRDEMRAMSLTGNAGGHMVPLTLDPAVILTSDGSANPLRRISRVVQTATNEWRGVTSAGATAEWIGESQEVADGSPVLAQPAIPVHKGDSFVPYSFEVGMDAVDLLGELRLVLVDAADQLMATGYTTGTGVGQPTGIVTALAGTSSEINTGGTEAMVAADAYTLQNALGARWQPNAQWVAHLATINTFAQFETANGSLKFPELRVSPRQLLGRPMNELSNMDGSINAAATANNYVMIYGDFNNFVIVDRIGTQMELVPHLFGANRRPTGQRGAFLWFRTGSDSVNDSAFRMLDVPTTA